MEQRPVIADRKPTIVELDPGEYWWCACGKSKNQPFCDGSHKGTGFQPVKFVIEKKRKLALCLCKHTRKPPLCDGSHRNL